MSSTAFVRCGAVSISSRVDLVRPRAVVVEPVGGDDVEEVDGVAVVVHVERLRPVGDRGPVTAIRVGDAQIERLHLKTVLAELLGDRREHDRGELGGEFLGAGCRRWCRGRGRRRSRARCRRRGWNRAWCRRRHRSRRGRRLRGGCRDNHGSGAGVAAAVASDDGCADQQQRGSGGEAGVHRIEPTTRQDASVGPRALPSGHDCTIADRGRTRADAQAADAHRRLPVRVLAHAQSVRGLRLRRSRLRGLLLRRGVADRALCETSLGPVAARQDERRRGAAP